MEGEALPYPCQVRLSYAVNSEPFLSVSIGAQDEIDKVGRISFLCHSLVRSQVPTLSGGVSKSLFHWRGRVILSVGRGSCQFEDGVNLRISNPSMVGGVAQRSFVEFPGDCQSLSVRHCTVNFQRQNRGVWVEVEDLTSTNGTKAEVREEVPEKPVVDLGDPIQEKGFDVERLLRVLNYRWRKFWS